MMQELNVPLDMLYRGGRILCRLVTQLEDKYERQMGLERTKDFEVEILPGYKAGTKIKFDKAVPAEELYPGEPKVDVHFVVNEEPHKVFTRRGDHLFTVVSLTSQQLKSGGFQFEVPLLSGKPLRWQESRSECPHGGKRTFKGLGMPIRKGGQATGASGDLIITYSWPIAQRINARLFGSPHSRCCER